MIEAEIYKALGDPVRLQMVMRLANGSPCTISQLTQDLGITRQGARKQLQVLVDAKMVQLSSQGRETRVDLDIATLQQAHRFIAELERRWDQRLASLKRFVETEFEH